MSHIFGWAQGMQPLLPPKQAPKGRTTTTQANGLGPKTSSLFGSKP